MVQIIKNRISGQSASLLYAILFPWILCIILQCIHVSGTSTDQPTSASTMQETMSTMQNNSKTDKNNVTADPIQSELFVTTTTTTKPNKESAEVVQNSEYFSHESGEVVEFQGNREQQLSVEQTLVKSHKPPKKDPAIIQMPMLPIAVPKICSFPPLLFNDCMSEPRWYYSEEYRSCLPFQSGSQCDSNGNNFPTKSTCEAVCKTTVYVEMEMRSMTDLRCGAPRTHAKLCRPGRWPDTRFYYDDTLNRCVPFRVGGCAASNTFVSLDDCTFFCRQLDIIADRVPPVACVLPEVRGFEVCFNGQARWYHSVRSGRCEWFMYSGCFGNWNNFLSYGDCQNVCQGEDYEPNVCSLPMDVGTSFQHRTRYYYDQSSNKCKPMQYSGFGGNPNNFFVPEECEAACIAR